MGLSKYTQKCGNADKVVEVFENMKQGSVVSWTMMITRFALHGFGSEALECCIRWRGRMLSRTMLRLFILSACSHVEETELGRWYFDSMSSRYSIKRRIEHYGCMVDILSRARCLREAECLIRDMPFEANGAVWGALLALARIHGDGEAGELALKHLINVEPHNNGNYTLLSNIYTAYEKWDEVGKLRKLMKDRGVKKMPGGSCIKVDGTVCEFKKLVVNRGANHFEPFTFSTFQFWFPLISRQQPHANRGLGT